jgi:predicted acetyltransferase
VDFDIRPIGPGRLEDAIRLHAAAFTEEITGEHVAVIRPLFEYDRNLAAFDGDTMIGQASASAMELTVPGAVLPAAGITAVGVLPTHRRRGVGQALMRRQLHELHEQDTPLAYLWASEGRIYQRFGYGLGSLAAAFDISRRDTELLRPADPGGRMRLVDRAEALKSFPAVYDRVRPTRPGMVDRDERWWQAIFLDIEKDRDGATPFFWATYEGEAGLEGYVVYRGKESRTGSDGFDNILEIEELLWATDRAYLGLWTYCFGVDLVGHVKGWRRPVDESLLYMLAEPRGLGLQIRDGTWLRLVEVGPALEGRGYGADDRLVLRIEDGFCPWNEGTWELEGGPGGASCRPTDVEPDLALDASTLACAYLGAVPFRHLAPAGRVEERTAGALDRADAMFASDPAPWCPHVF